MRAVNSALHPTIEQFIVATNAGDLSRLLRVFAEDSIVNDQLQEWQGLEAITRWAIRDVLEERLSLRLTTCVEHYGHYVVNAHADGTFDKRGLPDPLEVRLYFSLAEGKIIQLIVLRDRSGTFRLDELLRRSP
jgi:hypothetical protein